MDISFLKSYSFFFPQLWMGTFLGILLALFGTFLVLRRMAFLGITLSQIVTFGVALSLFLGWGGEWFAVIFSGLVFLPLVYFQSKEWKHFDSFLGILLVFFASFSQLLLSLGGNVKNQIIAAFFGDILIAKTLQFQAQIPILGLCALGYIFFFRKFLFLAWDKDEFIVRGYRYWLYEWLFFLFTTIIVVFGVHFLGSFYATAHMLVPAYSALAWARSIYSLIGISILLSVFSTWLGFTVSLIGFPIQNELVYFPTSSTIVVMLTLLGLILRWAKK